VSKLGECCLEMRHVLGLGVRDWHGFRLRENPDRIVYVTGPSHAVVCVSCPFCGHPNPERALVARERVDQPKEGT
jgi:hypothetical protein